MSLVDLETLKTEINFQMVSKLKRTQNPTKVFKVLINDGLKRYLIEKYRLNGRYRLATEFIQDFDILKKRNMALNSYLNVKIGSFQLKVNNNRRANYFEVDNGIMVIFMK
jgi:putative heme degradation protein